MDLRSLHDYVVFSVSIEQITHPALDEAVSTAVLKIAFENSAGRTSICMSARTVEAFIVELQDFMVERGVDREARLDVEPEAPDAQAD